MNRMWISIVLAGIASIGNAAEQQEWPPPRPAAWAVEPASNAFLNAADFDSPASTTRGIQEAIEALPPGGGTVFVPPGEHVIERSIDLRPGTQLIGAGRNTVLKKAPLVIVPLAEDVRKDADQAYVVVRDPAALRPGMAVTVCDRQQVIRKAPWLIRRVDGNKVTLYFEGCNSTGDGRMYTVEFKPTAELRVDRGAALVTAFWMISPAPDSLIENLSVDGNKKGQHIGGKPVFMDYAGVPNALRNIKGVGFRCTLRRLWIHDAVGVNVSCSSGRALITDCDIWGGWQGIHLGAGPLVKIVNNLVHDHEHIGISFCMGNFGCIVAQNHIYQNQVGIGALGARIYQYSASYSNQAHLARDGDHYHIITQNQIFNNRRAGISSGQGHLGPTDYVITDNIVMNNNLDGAWPLHRDDLPGGIAFYNARNCVIANNRCYDDQDEFGCGELIEDAPAGSCTITIKYYMARPVSGGPFHDPPHFQTFRMALSNGTNQEEVNVVRRDPKPGKNVLTLDAPLKFSYPKGTDPRILKSQWWGIIVTGSESRGNVISGNQCSENALGGLLVYNEGGAVGLNAGGETAVDPARSFLQNLCPAVETAGLSNPGFEEDSGWTLGAGAALDGAERQAGERSLKLALADDRSAAEARSVPFDIKPDRRYRVSGCAAGLAALTSGFAAGLDSGFVSALASGLDSGLASGFAAGGSGWSVSFSV